MHFEPNDGREASSSQTYFRGTHSQLVWNKAETVNDPILACALQKLQDSVGLRYKDAALAARFPRKNETPQPRSNITAHTWADERGSRRLHASCFVLGTKTRVPGSYGDIDRPELQTREVIHPSVMFGKFSGVSPIPGFTRRRHVDGHWFWDRTCSRRSLSGLGFPIDMPPCHIDEGQFGELEASLLGVQLCRNGC